MTRPKPNRPFRKRKSRANKTRMGGDRDESGTTERKQNRAAFWCSVEWTLRRDGIHCYITTFIYSDFGNRFGFGKINAQMPQDKYSAIWVSHSSIGDFVKCPRAYYLHNVYKDPKTRRKINIVSPSLSLGQAVHSTIEPLKNIPAENRLKRDLISDFEKEWEKVSGHKGGFKNDTEEKEAKERGKRMIERVIKNPGPIGKKTLRLKSGQNDMLPNFFISEKDNIILCGLIDWLQYIEEDDSIRIVDFKTGKKEEGENSLQLPIYLLLLNALQKRKVSGASYWYLERDDKPRDVPLPDIIESREKVLSIAKEIKQAREKKLYNCPEGKSGCFTCRPFEAIVKGEAEYIGVGGYGQDMYFVGF